MSWRALDLFCGAGGVTEGLRRAGFEVVGVDINPQPHHRGGIFVQADALTYPLEGFDFIWASPPCQAYSALKDCNGPQSYPDLVQPVRARLQASGALWVIENVPGAPLRHGFMLCGLAFGLEGGGRPLRRHRLFEPSWPVLAPPCHCDGRQPIGVYGGGGHDRGAEQHKREAMGIDWMNRKELAQAIPPAYAEWIGRQAIQHLEGRP